MHIREQGEAKYFLAENGRRVSRNDHSQVGVNFSFFVVCMYINFWGQPPLKVNASTGNSLVSSSPSISARIFVYSLLREDTQVPFFFLFE